MKKVLAALLFLSCSCINPGARTDIDGSLRGRISANSEWLVAVGAANLDVKTTLPQGVTVSFPLKVQEGRWIAVELSTGAFVEGSIMDPLPPEIKMYTPEEWEQIVVGEFAKLP